MEVVSLPVKNRRFWLPQNWIEISQGVLKNFHCCDPKRGQQSAVSLVGSESCLISIHCERDVPRLSHLSAVCRKRKLLTLHPCDWDVHHSQANCFPLLSSLCHLTKHGIGSNLLMLLSARKLISVFPRNVKPFPHCGSNGLIIPYICGKTKLLYKVCSS